MAKRKVTIRDVAERAGVSVMTVSNVLSSNQERNRHVSEATRTRVLETIGHLEFRPNASARSLRRRSTNIIGIYSGYRYLNAEDGFLAAIIGGVQEGCDAHCKDLLLHGVFRNRSVTDIYAELADGRIDGLIVHAPPKDPLIDLLVKSELPVVMVADAVSLLPAVVVDDAQGARMQAEHLARRAPRRVVYYYPENPPLSVARRFHAFCAEATLRHWEVIERPSTMVRTHVPEESSSWMDLPYAIRPTAAVCWNDRAALDTLAHCLKRGLRVPEDIAIIGFDGITGCYYPGWQLTTVHAPWAQVARTAVDLLVHRIEGGTLPPETVLPVDFIVGDSA